MLQAAIAHAQFETIHPFIDGNGRVGRCLIHVVLRRRGLTPLYVPPISLILASNRDAYFAGLEAFRRWDGLDEWAGFFAETATRAATEAARLAAEIQALQERWRERFSDRQRSDAAAWRVLEILAAHPVLKRLPSRTSSKYPSGPQARRSVSWKRRASFVSSHGRVRGRLWECPDLFDLIQGFEDGLRFRSSRGGPARPAPPAKR